MIPCCQEDIKKILRRLPPLSLPLAASSPLVAPALFICFFGWLLRRLAASLRCIPSRRHVTSRCVSSHLVSSRLAITSCLDVASRLVITSLLVVASHCVASRRVSSRRVALTLFGWLSCLQVASQRCVPSSRPLVHVVVASRLVVATRCIPSHCFIAAFCLFGCRVTYPSASISTLVARRQR
jgi:hypothetical protein